MGSSQPNRVVGAMSSFFTDWAGDNRDTTARTDARPDLAPIEAPRRGARLRRGTVAGVAVLAAATACIVVPMTGASADPSEHTWYRLRMCESSDNYSTDTGNAHYGAYQFDLSTWRSVGGSGYPSRASKAEQDKRALILYRERGWQPWQCARILGLREDSDARSGRTGDLHGSSPSHSSSGVPGFPGGSHWYVYGDNNSHIKTFQNEMHHR
ncbi:transglycosylase family protein, partial [uncultured Jatrophihabitans sp.]|uniref:transglycosylase family protein n=1 Tax=uncultured Jatrophihabitans sp. TaxID=1610747 RepID=UPI0035CC7735